MIYSLLQIIMIQITLMMGCKITTISWNYSMFLSFDVNMQSMITYFYNSVLRSNKKMINIITLFLKNHSRTVPSVSDFLHEYKPSKPYKKRKTIQVIAYYIDQHLNVHFYSTSKTINSWNNNNKIIIIHCMLRS